MTSQNPLFVESVSKLLDGDFSEKDTDEILSLIMAEPTLQAQLVDFLILDTLLEESLGQETLTALVDAVTDRPSPSQSPKKSHTKLMNPIAWLSIRRWGWLAVAASLVFVVLVVAIQGNRPILASASKIVQAAMYTHAAPVERIYVVEVKRGPTLENLADLTKDVRIATQGDQFWVQMRGARTWTWGRTEQGDIWMTLGSSRAVVIHPDEMGKTLRHLGDLYSLNLQSLLENVLQHCQLEMSDSAADSIVIVAIPRRQWSKRPLQRATIEVDRETKAIRKLTIEREFERSNTISTFTLVDSRAADESLYKPEGHLSEPFRILPAETVAERRREVIMNWFGLSPENWLTPPNPSIQKNE
jgi:hypothetical protein